jgi:glycosyltransferase involved in cell wall biosynthesis
LVFVNRYFDPDQSATSRMLTDLAQALAARGITIHVVCSRQLYDDPDALLPRDEIRSGVTVHRVATTRFGRSRLIGRAIDYLSFYVSAGMALMALLKSGDMLIAKTDPPLISIVAAVIARLKRASLVNWQQDVFPEVASHLGANPFPRPLDLILRRLRDWSMRAAKVNVVIGTRMFEYFQQRGIPVSRLCVIDNWADDETITPRSTETNALRERLGLTDRFVVCYSGNLGRAHEFDTLLAAADDLRLEEAIVFLMIGGGARMVPLQRAVEARALDNFLFLPYQPREDLEDSLAAADVHLVSLLPALEGFIMPSKLYGILAAGRPVIFIGDSDGDTARIIRNAECGITVPVGAGGDLAAVIRRLMREPDARIAMGARARTVLTSSYSRSIAVDRWLTVLDVKRERRSAGDQPRALSNR